LLSEVWEPAQAVLADRFPDVPLHGDIRELAALPAVDVVTAGFPCTDLSQAGRTAGITGKQSGLVGEVFRLLRQAEPRWLLLENVRNMLPLDGGKAMRYLVDELETLGYHWAYRVVDSRFTGVPQRRHRVLLLASRTEDPRDVLLVDDAGEPAPERYGDDAYGFYWTEGLRGLGWARDATPPLKGGSTIGIPSPPAVWLPGEEPGRKLVTPAIEHAEQLQGFPAGWTEAAGGNGNGRGHRWKLVGNAVTAGVAQWVGERLAEPGTYDATGDEPLIPGSRWPNAAWGGDGEAFVAEASFWPRLDACQHLSDVAVPAECRPLSHRGAAGFLNRANRGQLRFVEEFMLDVKEHVELTAP
jgi:DNA (cytosine-5)-methyltransferase 1